MASVKELSQKQDVFCAGHRACAGCAPATTMRQVTLAADTNIVTGLSTGCMEVVSTIYPYTAWRCSFIHNAFENVAATISGVEAAYRALKRKGKLDAEYRFMAMGGDGGTYDIGLQSLSGAMERGHRMLYICYDNQGYMNTGIQRSSSTPFGAATSTTPAGVKIPGKQNFQKNLTEIMVGHELPYVAQASIGYHRDLLKKVEKALSIDGRPLYEVENGNYKLSRKPKEKLPIEDWLKGQGRFAHIFKPENEDMIKSFQAHVDQRWERLLKRCDDSKDSK
jgi:pyruvate ferredoxin oxidoreductase beta subunit